MLHAKHISKRFLLPHESRHTVRDFITHPLQKVRYETFEALNDISFSASPGEWVGIIGSNGSGKSTLLKILAGIYEPNTGTVEVNGKLLPFLELGVGFEPELSAHDNIFLNGLLLGMTREQIKTHYDDIVRFSEVGQFLDQKLKNFSSGMKLRLAFAIEMHASADVFLIDEVFSVGDLAFQKKSLQTFKQTYSSKTIIIVSHNLAQLQEHCNTILWLDKGEIKDYGRPTEIIPAYTHYMTAKKYE